MVDQKPDKRADKEPDRPYRRTCIEGLLLSGGPLLFLSGVLLSLPGLVDCFLNKIRLFFADGLAVASRRRDSIHHPGRPDHPDLQRLVGRKVGRGETGRPGIDNLGPARKRAVPIDENILLARRVSRQGYRDRD